MADETELRRDAARADRARALLSDELLTEAFEKLRAYYIDELIASPVSDAVRREKLFFAARVLPAVRNNLEKYLIDGTVAAKQLANLEDDMKRNKR